MIKNIPKLRFKEFTDEWQEKKLGDLNIYVSDGNYGEKYPKASDMKSSGVPFIRANNIKDSRLVWNDMKYISPKLHDELASGHLESGDILVTTRGEIGTIAIVTNEFENSNINAQICLLRADGKLSSDYLYQYLGTKLGKTQFRRLQSGSALKQLPKDKLRSVKISVPTKPEQKKIANFLTAVDEKIGKLEEKKKGFEKYKKGVMQAIFNQRIRFKPSGENPTPRSHGEMGYPDWEEKRLGEIGKTFNGLTSRSAEDFGEGSPYITYMQIFGGASVDISKCRKVRVKESDNQNEVKKGDIFFTTSSETPQEVGFSSALLDDAGIAYLNSFCFGYRLDRADKYLSNYLNIFFRSEIFRRKVIRLAQGSTRFNLSKIEMMKITIEIPDVDEQQKIAEFLTALDDKIKLINNQLEQAKLFKKSLLQRMFV